MFRFPNHLSWSRMFASLLALSLVVQPAMGQTPLPVEPPGSPGTVVFVDDVGVSLRADTNAVPRGCNPTEVVQLITAYLDAFNRSDQQQLLHFFSSETDRNQEGAFNWYSVGGPTDGINPGFNAASRDELMVYLTERHTHDERMTLLQIDYGTNPTNRYGEESYREIGFTLDVLRSADDIPTHQAGVKGGIDCQELTIYVWSQGDRGIVPDNWFDTPQATPSS